MTLSIGTPPPAPVIPALCITPSSTDSQLPLPSADIVSKDIPADEAISFDALLKDLPFNPCLGGASSDEVEICTKIFHSIYNKENQYRFIQPSEAHSVEGSIITVLRGIRPLGIFTAANSSAYVCALKTISGIHIVKKVYSNPVGTEFYIVRDGSKRRLDFCEKTNKHIEERVAKEGYPSMPYKRILDSCNQYGKMFNYHPDAIADFETTVKKRLADEHKNSKIT